MAPKKSPELVVLDETTDEEVDETESDICDLDYLDDTKAPHNLDTTQITRNNCRDGVKAVFPDICLDYLETIALEHDYNSGAIIGAILDLQEKGEKYPVEPRNNPLKRKREEDDEKEKDEEEEKDREAGQELLKDVRAVITVPGYYETNMLSSQYKMMAQHLMVVEYVVFPTAPLATIRHFLHENKKSIFEAYTAMDEAIRNWDEENPPWRIKKIPSKRTGPIPPLQIDTIDITRYSQVEQAAITEFRVARRFKSTKDAAGNEEAENLAHARSTGQMTECGCCFDEFPTNRMIQCDGENVHWFCRTCMKSQAETMIGLSRHGLTCMSMDGCSASFSPSQRELFLDKKSRMAFDRIELEAELRMAGIENLETCPFCPYAAEYPPIEVDKEFRCVNPGCEVVSCRLCRKETHIPKTCAESATDSGVDARHVLEEAMSAAIIRNCNKCQNPFLKVDGCNKIRCTKCNTVQCYVCRATITDYQHFDDTMRGGKEGQCPLYDSTEQRHKDEVERAEEEARQKLAKDNPNLTTDALKFKVSEAVQQDEQQRLIKDGGGTVANRRRMNTQMIQQLARQRQQMIQQMGMDMARNRANFLQQAQHQSVPGPDQLIPGFVQHHPPVDQIPLQWHALGVRLPGMMPAVHPPVPGPPAMDANNGAAFIASPRGKRLRDLQRARAMNVPPNLPGDPRMQPQQPNRAAAPAAQPFVPHTSNNFALPHRHGSMPVNNIPDPPGRDHDGGGLPVRGPLWPPFPRVE